MQKIIVTIPGDLSSEQVTSVYRGERPIALGSWIRPSESATNAFYLIGKSFRLTSDPTEATFTIASHTRYRLYVNGEYVGAGPVPGGRDCSYADSHKIASHLKKGTNHILLNVESLGVPICSREDKTPAVNFRIEITQRKQTVCVLSDETCKFRRNNAYLDHGGRVSEDLGFKEVYDAKAGTEMFAAPKLSDKSWKPVELIKEDDIILPRLIDPLAETTVLPVSILGVYNSPERPKDFPIDDVPKAVSEAELSPLKSGSIDNAENLLTGEGAVTVKTPRGDKPVAVVLDFGRIVSGSIFIEAEDSAAGIIDISYGETLSGDTPEADRNDVMQADRIILKKGPFIRNGFDRRSFRYVMLEFRRLAKPLVIKSLRAVERLADMPLTGSFECSDDILNKIWKRGANTLRLCMQDVLAESPFREQTQWWGDISIMGRSIYYAYNDTSYLRQAILQTLDGQYEDGMFPARYPSGTKKVYIDCAQDFLTSVCDYYGYSNNKELMVGAYPQVRNLVRFFDKYLNSDNLLENVEEKIFIDWEDYDTSGISTVINALYCGILRTAAIIAEAAEKYEDAEKLVERADTVKKAINKFFYIERKGLYCEGMKDGKLRDDFLRQTNILLILSDVPDYYRKAGIFRMLSFSHLPQIVTPYFSSKLNRAYIMNHRNNDAIYNTRKNWSNMLRNDYDTLREDFEGMGGMCYGWSTAPVGGLIGQYLGIKPVVGSRRFAIAPHAGGLKRAKGGIMTDQGPLNVSWYLGKHTFNLKVEVPEGLKVDIYPPGGPDCGITVNGEDYPINFISVSGGVYEIVVIQPFNEKTAEDNFAGRTRGSVEVLDEIYSLGKRKSLHLGLRKPKKPKEEPAGEPAETEETSGIIIAKREPGTPSSFTLPVIEQEKTRAPRRKRMLITVRRKGEEEILFTTSPNADFGRIEKRNKRNKKKKTKTREAETTAPEVVETAPVPETAEPQPEPVKEPETGRKTITIKRKKAKPEPVKAETAPEPEPVAEAKPAKKSRKRISIKKRESRAAVVSESE